jgi:DNA primase
VGARAATGGNGASGGSGTAGGSGVSGGNGAAAARPFSRRPAPGPTRAQKALWEKQCLLLTWIIDDPRIFPQISRYLQPDDFDGEIYVRTASGLWDQLRKDPEAANAASVISSFETPQEQEAAAAMFNSHLEGIEDKNDREKTLRELVFFIKQASLDRMTRAGGAGSLQTLLTAKQQLQSLRSANFHL